MKIKKVKIIKASLNTYWYAKNIGEEFYTVDSFVIHTGLHEGKRLWLDEKDIEVIEEFEGKTVNKILTIIERI
jgi:hypothetical protein